MPIPSTETVQFPGSSFIAGATYDRDSRTLVVQFKGGPAFRYLGVPVEKWSRLQSSPSAGSYFHRQIKQQHQREQVE